METSENFNQVYSDYLRTNKAFWDRFSPKKMELGSDYIAVDAMVDFPSYILGNLIIAKYLQSFTGCRILAIVRNSEQLARWKELFVSFSVDEVFFAMADEPFPYSFRVEDIIREKEGPGLRESILQTNINGMPVGDLIYDAYLRDTGEPTIFQMNSTLDAYIRLSVQFYDRYNLLFKQKKITHCIVGHTVYLLYGVLARVAVEQGAIVYGRKTGSTPLTIMRYKNLNDFPMGEICVDPTKFEILHNTKKEQSIKYANDFISKRFGGEAAGPWGAFTAYSKDRIAYNRDMFISTCEIDNNNPIVFIMCHAFTDSPHCCSTIIHHDYYDWLKDTLKIISEICDINWVVKPHPEDKYYMPKIDHGTKLGMEYSSKYKHIFLCPKNLNSSSLKDISNMFLTVRGTCAAEFATLGIPSIVTEQGNFTQLGFLQECYSREQYIQALTNKKNINNLNQCQIDRAKTALYYFQYVLMVDCVFFPSIIPSWVPTFEIIEYWNSSKKFLTEYHIKEDPLYNNFLIQYYHDQKQLLRYDEFPELHQNNDIK